MKNQNWFEASPLSSYFNFAQQALNKEPEHEDEQQLRIIQTPQFNHNQFESPFADPRLYSPEKPKLKHQENAIQPIEQVVVFSAGESDPQIDEQFDEQDAETPQKSVRLKEEVNSTGCKSHNGKVVQGKKSRPKDKGLRGLSSRAFKVVLELKSTTYKEVALRLLKELAMENQLEATNEQTNVKRRVYDALNVLIAVGILEKDGRKIVVRNRNKYSTSSQYDIELKTTFRTALAKQVAIQDKQAQIEKAKKKLQNIQSLISRNKANKAEMERTGKFIALPFIGVTTTMQNYEEQKRQEQSIHLRFHQMIRPFGDVDSLGYL